MEISPPNSGPVISHGGSKIGVIIAREKISCTRTADQDSPLIATRRRTPPLGWSIWVEMGSPWIRGISSYNALGNQKARRDGRAFPEGRPLARNSFLARERVVELAAR